MTVSQMTEHGFVRTALKITTEDVKAATESFTTMTLTGIMTCHTATVVMMKLIQTMRLRSIAISQHHYSEVTVNDIWEWSLKSMKAARTMITHTD